MAKTRKVLKKKVQSGIVHIKAKFYVTFLTQATYLTKPVLVSFKYYLNVLSITNHPFIVKMNFAF